MLEFLAWAVIIYLGLGVFFACLAVLSIVSSDKNPFGHTPYFLGLIIMFVTTVILWLPAAFKSEMER